MLSIPDMALLGAAALMFFGPEQLPKVARKVGTLVRDVQNTSNQFIREMERAADEGSYSSYNTDISRAHLIEDPLSPATTPPPYQPAEHEPYAAESYLTEPFNGHPYAPPPEPAGPHHDIVAPRPPGPPAADHDLPP
ncbi:MAG: twin-arginine translocase TatA/TatE family subunit [Candidatus Lustribacter sp.]|jgi:sec-independent protein translocase protein TatA